MAACYYPRSALENPSLQPAQGQTPFTANAVRACDFMFDTIAEIEQNKCLTTIEEYAFELASS